MNIRKTGPVLMILVAGGVASPVLADCCSSIWSCAATVVTYGVSCEVQTIIDTLNDIKNGLATFMGALDGSTQDAERGARQSVADTLNTMQSQSQQSASDLAAALSQVQLLLKEEKTIIEYRDKSQVNQDLVAGSPTTSGGTTEVHPPRNEQAKNGAPVGTQAQVSQAPVNQSLVSAGAPANPMLRKGTVGAEAPISNSEVSAATPHGELADTFARAVKQIEVLKSAGDSDLDSVNGYLVQAKNSEGPGDAQADSIAALMFSPLNAIKSEIDALLSNPIAAFDPSSIVDNMESTFMANLTSNVNQIVAAITTGPDKAFTAAQPTYDDLLAKAENAQAIAAAATELYKRRTTAAAEAVNALVPITEYAGTSNARTPSNIASLSNRASQSNQASLSSQAPKFGQRQSFAVLSARMLTTRQRALQAFRKPDTTQLHAAIVKFKAQRAAGKSPLPQSTLAAYQNTLKQQLDGHFNGKPAAAVANERDQLIAEARSKLARDPATANNVVALLNSEAAKRTTGTNLATREPNIPGQPVPRVVAPNAATAGTATGAFKQPVAIVAPSNAPVSQATIIQAPANQPKAPTWGPAQSGWTAPGASVPATSVIRPAVTTGTQPTAAAATSFKSTTTQTSVQPVQQYQPVQQAQPVQQYQPVQQVQQVQQYQPVQQVQPVQQYQPVQQVQPAQQYQPVQQMQQVAPSSLGH